MQLAQVHAELLTDDDEVESVTVEGVEACRFGQLAHQAPFGDFATDELYWTGHPGVEAQHRQLTVPVRLDVQVNGRRSSHQRFAASRMDRKVRASGLVSSNCAEDTIIWPAPRPTVLAPQSALCSGSG